MPIQRVLHTTLHHATPYYHNLFLTWLSPLLLHTRCLHPSQKQEPQPPCTTTTTTTVTKRRPHINTYIKTLLSIPPHGTHTLEGKEKVEVSRSIYQSVAGVPLSLIPSFTLPLLIPVLSFIFSFCPFLYFYFSCYLPFFFFNLIISNFFYHAN